MSSIMDELKTLQSERTGPGTLDPAEAADDGPPAGGGPVLRTPGPARRRPTALVLGVGIALGALLAALVLPGRGAKSPARDGTEIARASRQPAESVAGGEENVPSTSGEVTADEPEPAEMDTAEPAQTKPGDADSAVAAEAAGGADETPEGPPDEGSRLAAAEEATESPDEPGPETVEAAAAELAEKPARPVRVLTAAEDEANKAAIRGLKVFGVLVDQKGVGVYTSEGELRAGSRFNDMEVTEVTSRYVVFESGNKRYRWLLPGRRSAKAGGGGS